jgi:hypothetical protein
MRGRDQGPCAGTHPLRHCASWGLLLMAAASVARAEPGGEQNSRPDTIYGYTDDQGRIVHVQHLEDVPPRLRAHARRLDQTDEPSLLDSLGQRLSPDKPAVLYRYRTADGRTKFTNLRDSVPAGQRAGAEVDLSRVSLNSQLGRDLDRRLNEEYARLAEQPACQQLRAAADRNLLEVVWREHGPIVVCGGAILLLVLGTPYMVRRVGGPAWSRTLGMAVPILAFVGISAYAVVRSSQALSKFKLAAAPCEAETWNALAQQDHGLIERYKLLQGMRAEQAALEQIAQEAR